MKKIISLLTVLLIVLAFSTGTALAKPGNGNGNSKQVEVKANKVVKEIKSLESVAPNKKTSEKSFKVNTELKQALKIQKQLTKQVEKTMRFSDTETHWAAESIETLSTMGILNGYPDGSFNPDGELSQAEAISLIMQITEETDTEENVEAELTDTTVAVQEETDQDTADAEENNDNNIADIEEQGEEDIDSEEADTELSDVPEWAKGAAKKAAQKGVINMNRFHSPVQASRAQVAVWIARALEVEPVDMAETTFADGMLISSEDIGYIMALQQEGIICGSTDGNFNPNSAITRAQMAEILVRLLSEEIPEDGQDSTVDNNTDEEGAVDETSELTETSDETDELAESTDEASTDETGTDEENSDFADDSTVPTDEESV